MRLSGAFVTQLMYRSENVLLGGDGAARLTVLETSPLAGRWVLSGLVGGHRLSVTTDDLPADAVGSELPVRFPDVPDAVFDADGERVSEAVVSS